MQRATYGALVLLGMIACHSPSGDGSPPAEQPATTSAERADERAEMVERQLWQRGIDDPAVLDAMRAVPRHRFVPADVARLAYADRPLPIGHDVTISQPYVVALMTQLAEVSSGEKVLEVGTGSGYQAAVLAQLGAEVYSIERIEALAKQSAERLRELGYANVHVRYGDGFEGWPEHAPFDAILLTAAPEELPQALLDQLAPGGRLVAPVGMDGWQDLVVVERTPQGLKRHEITGVAFVPMLPGTTPQ